MDKFKTRLVVWFAEWKKEFLEHKYLIALSLLFFLVAIAGDMISSKYVDKIPTTSVSDIILDHLPTLDLDSIFIYGLILVIGAIFFYVIIFKIREAHIVLSQFSLLVLVRSFFLTLTHLGQPAGALVLTNVPWFYQFFNFNNDVFFSAHTAIPFLGFLLFRKDKIGKFFLLMTFVMAFTVLALHMHYSIDVFSAVFITYGTYKMGEWFFRRINHY